MKYIDADKLRAEIDAFYTKYKAKFHQNGDSYHLGIIDGLDMAERILDTLEEPEQPTMGYDEAYLNEKIAKASKSWEGVDVDKFMDEVRGREPVTTCDQLEEAKEGYIRKARSTPGHEWMTRDIEDAFKAGAEWQKRKMMEGAVECSASVCKLADKVWVTPNDEKKFHQDVFDHFIAGDKVRIIIAKEDEQ